jgi:hypothetical protein
MFLNSTLSAVMAANATLGDDSNDSDALKWFDTIIGWIYTLAWSSSFYG